MCFFTIVQGRSGKPTAFLKNSVGPGGSQRYRNLGCILYAAQLFRRGPLAASSLRPVCDFAKPPQFGLPGRTVRTLSRSHRLRLRATPRQVPPHRAHQACSRLALLMCLRPCFGQVCLRSGGCGSTHGPNGAVAVAWGFLLHGVITRHESRALIILVLLFCCFGPVFGKVPGPL